MPVQRINSSSVSITQFMFNHNNVAIKIRLRTKYHVSIVPRIKYGAAASRQYRRASRVLKIKPMMDRALPAIGGTKRIIARPVVDIIAADRARQNKMFLKLTTRRHRRPCFWVAAEWTR